MFHLFIDDPVTVKVFGKWLNGHITDIYSDRYLVSVPSLNNSVLAPREDIKKIVL